MLLIILTTLTFFCCEDDNSSSILDVPKQFVVAEIDDNRNTLVSLNGNIFPARTHVRDSLLGKSYYLRVNAKENLSLIDLSSNSVETINIEKDGPESIDYLAGASFCDGSIVCFGSNEVLFFGLDGSFEKKESISADKTSGYFLPTNYKVGLNPNYAIGKLDQNLYLPLNSGDGDMFSFPYVYRHKLFGKFSREELTIELLPIYHRDTVNFFGALHRANASSVDKHLIVTYDYSPNIYLHSSDGTFVKEIEQKPAFGTNNIPYTGSAGPMDIVRHLNNSNAYGPFYSSGTSGSIYQIVLVPSPDNPGEARRGAVRVFDREFNHLGDVLLPKYSIPSNLFVDKGILYVQYGRSSLGEDELFYRAIVAE